METGANITIVALCLKTGVQSKAQRSSSSTNIITTFSFETPFCSSFGDELSFILSNNNNIIINYFYYYHHYPAIYLLTLVLVILGNLF